MTLSEQDKAGLRTTGIFRLDSSSGVPFYRQIIDQVLLAVADGRVKTGSQLPTVRQLAVDLSINLNTVAKAYREMEIRGIVETQQGTGTFVATRAREPKNRERKRALNDLVDRFIANAEALGIPLDDLTDALMERAEKARRRE
ncbi:MAG TPA: GntR family transcriptional regulator [Thermoanaerobaculia bacterium]|nr:GntR family transcriptional regulator [Thermoanaerobaculia bacterium]